jgi:hypothetical protein
MGNFKKGLAARLREVKGERTVADLAREWAIPHPQVSNYFKGIYLPSVDTLLRIGEKENVNLDWLLTGRGDMYLPVGWEKLVPEHPPTMTVPIMGEISEGPDGTVLWKEKLLAYADLTHAIMVRAKDYSMEQLLLPGHCAILVPEQELRDGDPALVKVRRKGLLFKLVFHKPHERLELQDPNILRAAPSVTIAEKDVLKIWRMIGSMFFEESDFPQQEAE